MSNITAMLILHGPLPTKQVYDFLMSHGYDIALIQTHEFVQPLPMVPFPTAYRTDGAIGKLQLIGVVKKNSYVVITTTNQFEEVVIRRVDDQLHIVYGRRDQFSYLSMNIYEFELEINQVDTNMAMSAVSILFADVKRRRINLDAYSDVPSGQFADLITFDYEAACRQIGWQWR